MSISGTPPEDRSRRGEPDLHALLDHEPPGGGDGTPMVRIEGLCKSFGETTVVRNIDLEIAAGEKVALIGPSGSGKTTILRILMTLERPDAGTIYLEGEPLWHEARDGRLVPASERHLRHMRQRVGMVFQDFNLFPHMRALGNITEALVHSKGVPKERAASEARELLAMVGLEHKADAFPAELSGGQQQRVAIARAIALRPKVMLFDEVTSALDPELMGEVLSVLRALARDTAMTMLIVTHQMHFARDVADRVLMFDEGKIVEDAPPATIFSSPSSERTQRFLRAVLEAM